MADFIGGIFGFAFMVGFFWVMAFINNPDGTKAFTKKLYKKARKAQ